MKTIFLENGHEKVINKLSDLPPITSNLLSVNLKLKPVKNIGGHNFGEPTLILFLYFIKFLPKIFWWRKLYSMLWDMSVDIREIKMLHNVKLLNEGYVLFISPKLVERKLELINKVNLSLSKLTWLEKFFIKKMMKKFYKKINPLIYGDRDKLYDFGHSIHYLYYIFVRDFKISTEK